MQLEKFYLDVITPSGAGAIVYAAGLRGIDLTLASVLTWDGPGRPVQRHSLRGRLPTVSASFAGWRCPALQAEGSWSPRAKPIGQTLWSTDGREVEWRAFAPAADAVLRIGERVFAGFGYAEQLRIAGAPWRLPIDTLRWGRFVSSTDSVVWIQWEHAATRSWLWHNGREGRATEVTDARVIWPGHQLELPPGRTLRSGRLGATVFARWPAARRLLPAGIMAMQEAKACTEGTLTAADGRCSRGGVIHERVRLR